MPYIPQRYKNILNSHLEKIRNWIVKISLADPKKRDISFAFLQFLGPALIYNSIMVVSELSRLRYWMAPDVAGILMNVAWELERKRSLPEPANDLKGGFDEFDRRLAIIKTGNTQTLDALVHDLALAIKNIVLTEEDETAYKEMVNYSLTTLGPDILMDVYRQDFDSQLLQFLVMLWQKTAKNHYHAVIAPYEDAQIIKNGDCEVFTRIERALGEKSPV